MAKVYLLSPQQGNTPRSKGDFLVLATKHGWVAQKWPKKRGAPKTPYDRWRHKEFGIVANMVSSPIDLDYGTALEMVKGTTYVPRDFLMMCVFANAYVIKNPDGTEWTRYRDMTNNPQYMLEQLTSTPGSIIVRGDEFWTYLPPSSNGDVLTMVDGMPEWVDPSPLPANIVLTTVLRRTFDQNLASNTNHVCSWNGPLIDELNIWNAAQPTRLTFPANINRFRLSASVQGPAKATSNLYTCIIEDAAGGGTWLGSAKQNQQKTAPTNSFISFNTISPWMPAPSTPYARLRINMATAETWTFMQNTTFTIEAIIND